MISIDIENVTPALIDEGHMELLVMENEKLALLGGLINLAGGAASLRRHWLATQAKHTCGSASV